MLLNEAKAEYSTDTYMPMYINASFIIAFTEPSYAHQYIDR